MFPSFRHLWNALQEKRYTLRRAVLDYPFIINANGVRESEGRKRALFIFLSEPFIMRPSNPRFQNHQNLKQSLQMVRALGAAGFVVDVMDINSKRTPHPVKYDLIVSHHSDFVADEWLKEGGIKIYLATGMNHEVYNSNLLFRYRRLNDRRGCELVPQNLNEEQMRFVRGSDSVVGFGNEFTAGTWAPVTRGRVKAFNNYGTYGRGFLNRDWTTARKNFLFYAGRLQIVRGLDLLLEIFPGHPDLHLYVCSAFKHERPFLQCYEKELFQTPNIHPVGLVTKGEERFDDIVRRCGFVILPSCSDCQPGSVIEGMHAGLIPLVTKETGLEVEEAGFVFTNDSEEVIEQTVIKVSTLEPELLEERSSKSGELARDRYSESAFEERWRQIALDIASL